MTRTRIKHEQIDNEDRRNLTFRKRSDGVLKKAKELSILCGVDVAIIIHKNDQNNAVLWPSPPEFEERLQKFLDCRNEKERQSLTHESHLKHLVEGEMEEIRKLKVAIQFKKTQQLMVKFEQNNSFDGILDLNQLNHMKSFADHMLELLVNKNNDIPPQ